MKKHSNLVIVLMLCIFFLTFITFRFNYTDGKTISLTERQVQVVLNNLVGMRVEEAQKYALDNGIILYLKYQYDMAIPKGEVISQNRNAGDLINEGDTLTIVVSKGSVPTSIYQENKVNELGKVPIMMYHEIVDISSDKTGYIGGNVDKDGYNRTVEAFRNDLEFYYQQGYRMVRLIDYVSGIIDTELGKSPIILTFDDGNENNFKVLGEKDGELIIDPNCAVGVLEEFKQKYPDYMVTATFFVNQDLFGQDVYNEKILNWLVDHGYDVGNHTLGHVDFTKISIEETRKQVGGLYQILDKIIPNKYVKVVALPFGSPYRNNHNNYSAIINGSYQGKEYKTISALRVGWEAENSCFSNNFDATFLKRIRAYDNNGVDFDIDMNFKILEKYRYISDGDKDTIVILEKDKDNIKDIFKDLKIISY